MADPTITPVADPMIGRRIDRFILMLKLGEGGMGSVYLAEHEVSSFISCVIKVMLPELAQHPQALKRFRTEAEAASRLKHDNIVKIENFGVLDDGQMFLRFEHLEGESLDQHLLAHGGRLSLQRAFHLLVQACDALDYAHAAGVIHRDLKPENLFVIADRRLGRLLKVLDFGISRVLTNEELTTNSGISMGTPCYMAIEQYENAAGATNRADVYSMAIIMWQLLTGRLPWGQPDIRLLYHKQLTEIPARPAVDEMPFDVATILLRCLAVDPEERPSMRELATALASAIPATDRAPSGAEILADLVPRWVVAAPPSAETVRNSVDLDRISPLLWPQRETNPNLDAALPPLNVVTMNQLTASAAEPQSSTKHDRPRARAAVRAVTSTQAAPDAAAASAPAAPVTLPLPVQATKPARVIPIRVKVAILGLAIGLGVGVGATVLQLRLRTDSPPQSAAPAIREPVAPALAFTPELAALPPPRSAPEPVVLADAGIPNDALTAVASVPSTGPTSPPTTGDGRPSVVRTAPPRAIAPKGTGELAIMVKPWAAVWVNGKSISGGTPYRSKLPAGRYDIRIANDDLGKKESFKLTVEPNKTTIVEKKW